MALTKKRSQKLRTENANIFENKRYISITNCLLVWAHSHDSSKHCQLVDCNEALFFGSLKSESNSRKTKLTKVTKEQMN